MRLRVWHHLQVSSKIAVEMPFSKFRYSADMVFQKSISRSRAFLPVTIPLTTKMSARPSRSASTNTQPQDQEVSQTSASSDTRSKEPSPFARNSDEPRERAWRRRQTRGRPSEYGNSGIG